jgi:quercetin dioxygenase-like cupin family protein
MHLKQQSNGYRPMLPGIVMRSLAYGERTLMVEFHLAQGAEIPMHSHPHEQTGYLVSGHVTFLIDADEIDTTPGDSWCFTADVRHGVRVLEDSVIIEVFSPVREEYLSP